MPQSDQPDDKGIQFGITGERRFWVGVIIQAFKDITSSSQTADSTFWRRDATSWFKDQGPYFREVCDNANLDPDYVYLIAKEVLSGRRKIDWGEASYVYHKQYVARLRRQSLGLVKKRDNKKPINDPKIPS